MSKIQPAARWYDFTSFDLDLNKTLEILRRHCKKWAFQLEKAPQTEKLHYQGRFCLQVKDRIAGLKKKMSTEWHFSPTNKNAQNNFDYVTKSDTRVDGPWCSWDDSSSAKDILQIVELRPWQQKVVDSTTYDDYRSINVIVDAAGNNGKSIFSKWAVVKGLAIRVPLQEHMRDMIRQVCDLPIRKLYIFDLPRAVSKEQLNQFWSAVEEIKNGSVYDDRYHYQQRNFTPPAVWIFTNTKPNEARMSCDRWKIWTIVDNDLVRISLSTRKSGEIINEIQATKNKLAMLEEELAITREAEEREAKRKLEETLQMNEAAVRACKLRATIDALDPEDEDYDLTYKLLSKQLAKLEEEAKKQTETAVEAAEKELAELDQALKALNDNVAEGDA